MGEQQDPVAIIKALQSARALEGEVSQLRGALNARPAAGPCDPASREEIIRLLSKVILFRLSLADTKTDHNNSDNNRGKS